MGRFFYIFILERGGGGGGVWVGANSKSRPQSPTFLLAGGASVSRAKAPPAKSHVGLWGREWISLRLVVIITFDFL